MSDKSKPLGGLDVLADFIVGKDNTKNNPTDDKDNNLYQDIDPEDLQKQMAGDDKKDPVKKKDEVEPKKEDIKDDIKKEDKVEDKVEDISEDDKEYESEVSTFFGNELVKKLGLAVDEKDLKFESINEVLELMSEVVTENSKPIYASDEVEAFDEFVRNGGSLKNFYKDVYSGKLDTSSMDLEKEYDQRAVVRENLLNQGYKEDKIKKMISRYEESETLKEEAEDAIELLNDYNKKKADSLLAQQKKEADEANRAQQKFYEDVNSTIKTISNIGGFPLTEKEKRELLQYAFVPENDGLSKYQKELRGDVLNILESAYFTMTKKHRSAGDASKKGSTDAYKTLRDKLKAKGNKQVDDDNQKGKKLGGSSLGDLGKGIFFK
jgi:hypothetical protein